MKPEKKPLGLYIHIPFCRSLCNFCPYCKTIYDAGLCGRYIDALIREIHMVGAQAKVKREVTSLYFGGGTPALAAGRLGEIIGRWRSISPSPRGSAWSSTRTTWPSPFCGP